MRMHIGVAIDDREICAVAVRRGRVQSITREERSTATSVPETIAATVDSRRRMLLRPRVTIALGPGACQLKRLDGLPNVADARMASRLVRENIASLFMVSSPRAIVSDVERRPDGSTWAACFDCGLAQDAMGALRTARVTNVCAMPALCSAASVLPAGTYAWIDGGCSSEFVTTDDHVIAEARRAIPDADPSPPPAVEKILKEGEATWCAIAAYGAALTPSRSAFAIRPAPDAAAVRRTARLRVALTSVAFAIALVLAIAAPGLRAIHVIRATSRELDALRTVQLEHARLAAELARSEQVLDRGRRFEAKRGQLTLLVGELAQVLPDSTAIVTLRVDSLEGSLAALTPHAADLLPQLAGATTLAAARITGSVTKENVAGTMLERATIRFERAGASHASRRTRAGGA